MRSRQRYAALGERLLRPDRARDVAPDVARGDDPALAWEQLAARGVIPSSWVGASDRSFVAGSNASPQPPSAAACVAFAADVPGVTRAEALVKEAASRLRLFGHHREVSVRWRTDGVRGAFPCEIGLFGCGRDDDAPVARAWIFASALLEAFPERERERIQSTAEAMLFATGFARPPADDEDVSVVLGPSPDALDGWFAENAVAVALADAVWRQALVLEDDPRLSAEAYDLDGQLDSRFLPEPFAALPNPFEPLHALAETGYLFDWIDRDAVLVAPAQKTIPRRT